MPDVTPVQLAGIKDDWIKALSWIPFEHVEGAFTDWLEDTENLDARGRMVKPGIARIKQMAADRFESTKLKAVPRISSTKADRDTTISHEERRLVAAKFRAWRELGINDLAAIESRALQIMSDDALQDHCNVASRPS